jgi:hypothetical protein
MAEAPTKWLTTLSRRLLANNFVKTEDVSNDHEWNHKGYKLGGEVSPSGMCVTVSIRLGSLWYSRRDESGAFGNSTRSLVKRGNTFIDEWLSSVPARSKARARRPRATKGIAIHVEK